MTSRKVTDDRFRLAVNASPAAMIMIDSAGVIEFANAETERMFGYSVEDLIGQSIDMLVPTRLRGGPCGLETGVLRQSQRASHGRRARSQRRRARTARNFRSRSR